jgi:hypothetical protein
MIVGVDIGEDVAKGLLRRIASTVDMTVSKRAVYLALMISTSTIYVLCGLFVGVLSGCDISGSFSR